MEIRDVIHGVISIDPHELKVVDSPYFQRLRHIRQMGFAENSYPGATHNRYIHSLGALQTATLSFDHIRQSLKSLQVDSFDRFRAVVRLAALLHDIGHGPLSHTTEFAMPDAAKLAVPGRKKGANRKATHEDYTLKILLDSPLTTILNQAGARFGFNAKHVASLIEPEVACEESFFSETIYGETIHFKPLLHQLISSELDADRMDYLRRDSFFTGVNYGIFEDSWLRTNLTAHIQDGSAYLALKHKALYAFEDFLLSRYHMFLMVYLHHKTVVYDEMLARFLNDPSCEYQLPADIEKYLECTDAHLYSHLTKSTHAWAKRIIEKRPFRMLIETHSGIPDTESAREKQARVFRKIVSELKQKRMEYIEVESKSELSKYFGKHGTPIFVRYDNLYSEPSFIPINKCTALFTRYPSIRSISRLYVSPEDYESFRKQGRQEKISFE